MIHGVQVEGTLLGPFQHKGAAKVSVKIAKRVLGSATAISHQK